VNIKNHRHCFGNERIHKPRQRTSCMEPVALGRRCSATYPDAQQESQRELLFYLSRFLRTWTYIKPPLSFHLQRPTQCSRGKRQKVVWHRVAYHKWSLWTTKPVLSSLYLQIRVQMALRKINPQIFPLIGLWSPWSIQFYLESHGVPVR